MKHTFAYLLLTLTSVHAMSPESVLLNAKETPGSPHQSAHIMSEDSAPSKKFSNDSAEVSAPPTSLMSDEHVQEEASPSAPYGQIDNIEWKITNKPYSSSLRYASTEITSNTPDSLVYNIRIEIYKARKPPKIEVFFREKQWDLSQQLKSSGYKSPAPGRNPNGHYLSSAHVDGKNPETFLALLVKHHILTQKDADMVAEKANLERSVY